ncbi:MAG: hypothetical protein JJV91_02225 [Desulfosarcina sp.]|nr:hypothetical protein [Desulfobacterales bacterium]
MKNNILIKNKIPANFNNFISKGRSSSVSERQDPTNTLFLMPIKLMQQQHTIKDISPDQNNISYKCNRNAPLIYFELNTFSAPLPIPLAKFSIDKIVVGIHDSAVYPIDGFNLGGNPAVVISGKIIPKDFSAGQVNSDRFNLTIAGECPAQGKGAICYHFR